MTDDEEDHYLYGKDDDPVVSVADKVVPKHNKNTHHNVENDQKMRDVSKDSLNESEEEEGDSDSDIEFVIETNPWQRAEPLSRPAPYSSVRISSAKGVDKVVLPAPKTEPSPVKSSGIDVDHVAEWNGKSLYHIDLDSFREKPWRKPGADITDYFNYGFDEFTWMAYCAKQTGIRKDFTPQKFMQMMEQISGGDIMSMAPNMQVMMPPSGFPGMQGISGMQPEIMPMMGMGMSDMSGFVMNMGQMGQMAQMGQMSQMGFQQFPPGLKSMMTETQSGHDMKGKQMHYSHNPYNMQSYGGYNHLQHQYNTQMQGSKPIPSGPKAHNNIDGVKIIPTDRGSSSGNYKQEPTIPSSKEFHENTESHHISQGRNSGRPNMQNRNKSSNGGKFRLNH